MRRFLDSDEFTPVLFSRFCLSDIGLVQNKNYDVIIGGGREQIQQEYHVEHHVVRGFTSDEIREVFRTFGAVKLYTSSRNEKSTNSIS